MKKTIHNLLALLLLTTGGSALTPTEWQRRQPVTVAAPGLTKIALTAATFDSALPTLADLRLLDPSGLEVPFLLDRDSTPRQSSLGRVLTPKSFRSTPSGDTTQWLIETGTSEPLDAIDLETPAPFFLKAAHVEISADGVTWDSLGPALPVFRQFGAEQLRLPLNRRTAAFVRVTLDDFRSRKVEFSGAKILPAPSQIAPPILAPLGAQITRRDEFAGETVLTITLDGKHVRLGGLTLDAEDPLFMRRVDVTVREARGALSEERLIGGGTIYRLAIDGAPTRSQLDIPLEFTPATRELLVHIRNGDSPLLKIDRVQAAQHPAHLIFNASAAGAYTLLSGNLQADSPRYDLATFAGEMRAANAAPVVPGSVEVMPDYRQRESLGAPPMPDVPLTGAPLDPTAWTGRQTVQIAQAGVQELELDTEALARSLADGADLRLLRDGNQIPYLLERPALARSLALTPVSAPDPKRPNTSIWKLQLPQAGLPIQRISLSTTTPLFQRKFRLYEKVAGPEGQVIEIPLASGDWSRTPEPGVPDTKTFTLSDRLRGDTLWIETENGDNPAIDLSVSQAVYPVVRLIFKVAETDGFVLAYGNKTANAPRYDLNLVAVKLLTSSRNVAQLLPSGQDSASFQGASNSINGGYVFWAALAVVVVVLLVVVAKLLPKPQLQ